MASPRENPLVLGSPSGSRRVTYAEALCGRHGCHPADFTALAWRLAAPAPTRWLRPLIAWFYPQYFAADDNCLELAGPCWRRQEVADEVAAFSASLLRHGWLRRLGFGLSGRRLLRCYDALGKPV
jgi:hypothetical protein